MASATYTAFRDAFLKARLPEDLLFSLVVGPYTFNAAHALSDISPYVIWTLPIPTYVTGALGAPTEWLGLEWVLRTFVPQPTVAINGPYETLTPVGSTVKALVVTGGTAPATYSPMLYLDGESFPGLPAATLGGAIEFAHHNALAKVT